MPSVTLIGQAILIIGRAPLVMVCFLALILYLGAAKSRVLSLDLAQRLNIEAWLIQLLNCTGFACFFKNYISIITLSTAPSLWCDNVSAITLASNPVFHSRTKHIKIDYYFVKEKVVNHAIQIQHTSTRPNCRCLYKKPYCKSVLLSKRQTVCLSSSPQFEKGC